MSAKDKNHQLSRREFLAIGTGAFVVAALPLAASRRDRITRRTMPVMGTIAEFAVVHNNPARAHLAIDAAMAELTRIEEMMTRFRMSSDIGRANEFAGRRAIVVTAETAFVVNAALRWASATSGRYDPAIGGAIALWDVTHREVPPEAGDIARFSKRDLYAKVEVGTRKGAPVLVYHDQEVRLDLGSIAKGYAVDRAASVLRDHGMRGGLISVGGDLFAIGGSADGSPWRLGIQDPTDPARMIDTIEVTEGAVATSGTYIQHFIYRGRDYHHLLDPSTGSPRETQIRSFTVRSDTCMHADVAATAAYGLDVADARSLFARYSPDTQVVRIA